MNTIVRRSPAMMRRTLPQRLPRGANEPPVPVRYVTVIVAVICGWIEQW